MSRKKNGEREKEKERSGEVGRGEQRAKKGQA